MIAPSIDTPSRMTSREPVFPTPQWPATFKEAFCQKFGCAPEQYKDRAFWLLLYRHAIPAATWLMRTNPDFFREDFELLEEISEVRNLSILKQELSRFYGRNLRDKSWLRREMRIRISGKRVLALVSEMGTAAL